MIVENVIVWIDESWRYDCARTGQHGRISILWQVATYLRNPTIRIYKHRPIQQHLILRKNGSNDHRRAIANGQHFTVAICNWRRCDRTIDRA
jgi:hypothetical protein